MTKRDQIKRDRARLRAIERTEDDLRKRRAKHAEAAVAAEQIMRRHIEENKRINSRLDGLWKIAATIRARIYGERMESPSR